MKKMRVAAGTQSALKIRAIKEAFAVCGIEADVHGYDVPSGISHQPIGLDMMEQGAENRFRGAHKEESGADFFVGIESGLVQRGQKGWFDVICVTVASKEAKTASTAYSSYLPVPGWMISYIQEEDSELGVVIQKLAGGGEKDAAAYLSRSVFKREDQLMQALTAALTPFLNEDRYKMPGI